VTCVGTANYGYKFFSGYGKIVLLAFKLFSRGLRTIIIHPKQGFSLEYALNKATRKIIARCSTECKVTKCSETKVHISENGEHNNYIHTLHSVTQKFCDASSGIRKVYSFTHSPSLNEFDVINKKYTR